MNTLKSNKSLQIAIKDLKFQQKMLRMEMNQEVVDIQHHFSPASLLKRFFHKAEELIPNWKQGIKNAAVSLAIGYFTKIITRKASEESLVLFISFLICVSLSSCYMGRPLEGNQPVMRQHHGWFQRGNNNHYRGGQNKFRDGGKPRLLIHSNPR